jgi:hypothetical protein
MESEAHTTWGQAMEKQEILYPGRGTDGERGLDPLLNLAFYIKEQEKNSTFLSSLGVRLGGK